jgi:diguanylate cyclase (GGDEF)-like protein
MFRMPMAAVSFIDGHRQWLKARQGLSITESQRCDAICNIAISQSEPLVIEDTTLDNRVSGNVFVAKDPHCRFYAGAQLRTRDGHNLGALCIMDNKPHKFGGEQTAILADLAEMVVNELDLRVSVGMDHLTGELSRRAFKDEAERAKLLALRHGHHLSCMIFDLDHFKAINDTHGHAIGDLVLKRSVEACSGKLRKSDLIGRLGGEEFAVLFPHTPAASAIKVAEKAGRAIADLIVSSAMGHVRISASFGVAELDRAASDRKCSNALMRRSMPRSEMAEIFVPNGRSQERRRRNRCAECSKPGKSRLTQATLSSIVPCGGLAMRARY